MAQKSVVGENPLLRKFLFTIALLLIFRIGVHIPTPGVNTKAIVSLTEQSAGILQVLNVFSGGALLQFSVFALGVMPYISASIIIQLMTVVVPSLEQMQKEGGVGRQKLTRITRFLAVLIGLIQGFTISSGLEAMPETAVGSAVLEPGFAFRLQSALILTAGSMFVMWIGEQITEKGIGNGVSLLIFAGIVAYFPAGVGYIINGMRDGNLGVLTALGFGLFILAICFAVAFIEQSYRKIPIHYAKRLVGKRVLSAQATHLPLKVNMSGVIPAIFASTVLAIPTTFAGFSGQRSSIWMEQFFPHRWLYDFFFVGLVIFFCYFYTSITFKPDDIAENLKKQNAYIPGIRPGTETAEALDMVVTRLTLFGAFYMSFVCVVPALLGGQIGPQLMLGGTSLLITVSVALETIRQVSAQLATQRYDDLVIGPGAAGPAIGGPVLASHDARTP